MNISKRFLPMLLIGVFVFSAIDSLAKGKVTFERVGKELYVYKEREPDFIIQNIPEGVPDEIAYQMANGTLSEFIVQPDEKKFQTVNITYSLPIISNKVASARVIQMDKDQFIEKVAKVNREEKERLFTFILIVLPAIMMLLMSFLGMHNKKGLLIFYGSFFVSIPLVAGVGVIFEAFIGALFGVISGAVLGIIMGVETATNEDEEPAKLICGLVYAILFGLTGGFAGGFAEVGNQDLVFRIIKEYLISFIYVCAATFLIAWTVMAAKRWKEGGRGLPV